MPLLEIAQTRRFVSAMIRVEDTTAQRIDQYAAFMKTTADEVVDKALVYVFAKDKDFQEFLESPQANRVPHSLRVRTTSQNEVVDKALVYVFAKDKDFQEFLESPQANRVPHSLRVRTTSQNGSASEAANGSAKTAKATEAGHEGRPRS